MLTVHEAATFAGVTPSVIYEWVRTGRILARTDDKDVRKVPRPIPLDEIEALTQPRPTLLG